MSIELSDLLFNALNEQGYLFQEACEHTLQNREKRTDWEVKASEYHVSLEGQDTKVDIVLHSKAQSSPELYALVECKRADPAYVHWVFGTHSLPRDALCSALGLDCRQISSTQPYQINHTLEELRFGFVTDGVINCLEAKSDSNKRASSPQNIENAFGQVLKGVSGFAHEQAEQRRKGNTVFKPIFFIPVVVTTASLYVAYYKPEDVDLYTGKISKEKVSFGPEGKPPEKVEWVLVDYGAGENVAPKSIPENYSGVDLTELHKHKIRSIFVVNSESIVNFFSKLRLVL